MFGGAHDRQRFGGVRVCPAGSGFSAARRELEEPPPVFGHYPPGANGRGFYQRGPIREAHNIRKVVT